MIEHAPPKYQQHLFDIVAPVAYRQDPVLWANQVLKIHLWSRQRDIVESVVSNRQTAVQSCHGPGKSFTAATVVCWWLASHSSGDAFVVTTAPSGPQVKAILWREIKRLHKRGNLPGHTNLTEWYMGDELVAYGRKPADGDPTAFQGIHAKAVLIVLDEACGVPTSIWDAAKSLATNPRSRILAIGNPDDPESEFAKVCRPDSGWHVIKIDAFSTPLFTGESIPDELAEQLVSPLWVEERRRDWGPESSLWVSKVQAEFPRDDPAVQVIPIHYLLRAVNRSEDLSPVADTPVELGVDVGQGGDQSVIRERRGLKIGRVWRSRHRDPERLKNEVLLAIRETEAVRVKIDAIGAGWGVAGWLRSLQQKAHVAHIIEVNVAERAHDDQTYANLRAEIWWNMRQMCYRSEIDLQGLDEFTKADLIAPHYRPDNRGRIQIEKKDDTKKRLGRSPDDADALNLAFHVPRRIRGTMARAY